MQTQFLKDTKNPDTANNWEYVSLFVFTLDENAFC